MQYTSRIRKRAKHIEQGAQAKITTGDGRMLHGAMMALREHKTDAHTVNAAGDLNRGQVQVHTGRFQQVGTAAFTGYSAVAMFGHRATGRRNH